MGDGIMFRWRTDEEIEEIRQEVAEKTIELAMRAILMLDPHIYDEETVRAAAQATRDMLKEKI
jgi:hypothetical protein